MLKSTVTELPVNLEPTGADPFVDDLTPPVPNRIEATPARARLRSVPGTRAVPGPPEVDRAIVTLVQAASSGDHAAWTSLVCRFDGGLRAVLRFYRLAPADVDDVVQMTWLRAFESIDRLREPAAFPGWLMTTARREALNLLQRSRREVPTDDALLGEGQAPSAPDAALSAADLQATLDRAVAALPERHRRLITLLIAEPTLDYTEISERLAMPVGSIGPIRGRCLDRLRRDPRLRAVHDQATAA